MRARGAKQGGLKAARRRRWLRRAIQAGLAAGFVALLAAGGSYQAARAQVSDELVGFGEHLMAYAHARRQDAPRDVFLNGQSFRLSSGTTARTADEVLDHFEARCGEIDGSLPDVFEALELPASQVSPAPTLRVGDGMRGYVACLEMGPQEVTLGDFFQRVGAYRNSGDLSELGDFRYVFADEMGEGDERSTHFVTVWTVGSLNLGAMFPEEGDAPGTDAADVDRPPTSRRVLSGYERGQSQRLTVYETRRDEYQLEQFYRGMLEQRGWELLELDPGQASSLPRRMLVAERRQRMVTLVFQTDLETGYASAAVFESL